MVTQAPNSLQQSKQALRRQMLAARQALDNTQRERLDLLLCGQVMRYVEGRPGDRLAAFHAFGGEPELQPALSALDAAGYQIHLPILQGRQLLFRRWTRGAVLTKNRYGIPEPLAGTPCGAEELDCVLMPLVAFSVSGARLGMGGGYYDRTFAFRRDAQAACVPQLVGVAYCLQQVDGLPVEPWDVPLDAVITDQGVHRCQTSGAPEI
ncbi:MAG: 5-formyltetrahydrofolate cyclo-ligase [Wenzhouxiangella sp.]